MNTRTNKLLMLVIVMQALMLAGQWMNGSMVSSARAQVPDAGAQRNQVIDELRSTNAKLDQLTSLVASGKVQVRTVPGEERRDAR